LNESYDLVSECGQVQTTSTLRDFSDFPKRKMKIGAVIVAVLPIAVVNGGQLMPTAIGTAWRYNMTEEVGKGLDVRGVKADADGKIRVPVLYRIDSTENMTGKIFSSSKCTAPA